MRRGCARVGNRLGLRIKLFGIIYVLVTKHFRFLKKKNMIKSFEQYQVCQRARMDPNSTLPCALYLSPNGKTFRLGMLKRYLICQFDDFKQTIKSTLTQDQKGGG